MGVFILNDFLWSPTYTAIPLTSVITNNRPALMNFWNKYLLQKCINVFKWKMPKTWSENYFLYTLYITGFCSVLYYWKYGWIPQKCGLSGLNLYEEPSNIFISNSYVWGVDRKIGDGCVLFKLNPDYTGVVDIVNYYSMRLSEMALTAYANMQNTKISFLIGVDNNKEAEAVKVIVNQVLNGELAAIAKKDSIGEWDVFSQNVKQNYIVSDLIIDMRNTLADFNTMVGIPNANTDKKERMLKDEINSNNAETRTLSEKWLSSFKETCEELNNIAGENLMSVDWSDSMKEGDGYVNSKSTKLE